MEVTFIHLQHKRHSEFSRRGRRQNNATTYLAQLKIDIFNTYTTPNSTSEESNPWCSPTFFGATLEQRENCFSVISWNNQELVGLAQLLIDHFAGQDIFPSHRLGPVESNNFLRGVMMRDQRRKRRKLSRIPLLLDSFLIYVGMTWSHHAIFVQERAHQDAIIKLSV